MLWTWSNKLYSIVGLEHSHLFQAIKKIGANQHLHVFQL